MTQTSDTPPPEPPRRGPGRPPGSRDKTPRRRRTQSQLEGLAAPGEAEKRSISVCVRLSLPEASRLLAWMQTTGARNPGIAIRAWIRMLPDLAPRLPGAPESDAAPLPTTKPRPEPAARVLDKPKRQRRAPLTTTASIPEQLAASPAAADVELAEIETAIDRVLAEREKPKPPPPLPVPPSPVKLRALELARQAFTVKR